MVRILVQKLLAKAGKTYSIDSRIPTSLLLYVIYKRAFMLIRGIIVLQKRVFLGKGSKILNKSNFVFGKNVTIENNCELDGYALKSIYFGNNVKIGSYSKLLSTNHLATLGIGLKMGNNSAVGDFTHFGAAGGIEIGEDVIMGSYVSFHSENHNFEDTSKLIREQGVNSKGIKLGNNIWVGAKVTFLDGVEIGNNCVVAAGAVVKGDFPNNVVIGGVPAKILKYLA
ncbi:MAG: acyltransferase [Flavobacteriaceae bacterium]|nr:acyltransferase [Flavobacteriaceae bacterium]